MNTERARGVCPVNGQPGKRVERQTLQSLFLVDLRRVTDDVYWFCAVPDCPVAYFDDTGEVTFTANQVRVPTWQKRPDDPTTFICYCFKITNARLQADLQPTGRMTATEEITAGILEGRCACPITNPQGSCCLGNVRRAAQTAYDALSTPFHAQADPQDEV